MLTKISTRESKISKLQKSISSPQDPPQHPQPRLPALKRVDLHQTQRDVKFNLAKINFMDRSISWITGHERTGRQNHRQSGIAIRPLRRQLQVEVRVPVVTENRTRLRPWLTSAIVLQSWIYLNQTLKKFVISINPWLACFQPLPLST